MCRRYGQLEMFQLPGFQKVYEVRDFAAGLRLLTMTRSEGNGGTRGGQEKADINVKVPDSDDSKLKALKEHPPLFVTSVCLAQFGSPVGRPLLMASLSDGSIMAYRGFLYERNEGNGGSRGVSESEKARETGGLGGEAEQGSTGGRERDPLQPPAKKKIRKSTSALAPGKASYSDTIHGVDGGETNGVDGGESNGTLASLRFLREEMSWVSAGLAAANESMTRGSDGMAGPEVRLRVIRGIGGGRGMGGAGEGEEEGDVSGVFIQRGEGGASLLATIIRDQIRIHPLVSGGTRWR